jgi:hypothetical protein
MILYLQLGILFVSVINSSLAIEDSYFAVEHSLFADEDSLFAVVFRQGFFIGYDGFMERLDQGHLHTRATDMF